MLQVIVIAVSSNTNSFGLKSMILLAENGQGYQALSNELNLRPTGTILNVDPKNTTEELAIKGHLIRCGYECIKRLADADKQTVTSAFGPQQPAQPEQPRMRRTLQRIRMRH